MRLSKGTSPDHGLDSRIPAPEGHLIIAQRFNILKDELPWVRKVNAFLLKYLRPSVASLLPLSFNCRI